MWSPQCINYSSDTFKLNPFLDVCLIFCSLLIGRDVFLDLFDCWFCFLVFPLTPLCFFDARGASSLCTEGYVSCLMGLLPVSFFFFTPGSLVLRRLPLAVCSCGRIMRVFRVLSGLSFFLVCVTFCVFRILCFVLAAFPFLFSPLLFLSYIAQWVQQMCTDYMITCILPGVCNTYAPATPGTGEFRAQTSAELFTIWAEKTDRATTVTIQNEAKAVKHYEQPRKTDASKDNLRNTDENHETSKDICDLSGNPWKTHAKGLSVSLPWAPTEQRKQIWRAQTDICKTINNYTRFYQVLKRGALFTSSSTSGPPSWRISSNACEVQLWAVSIALPITPFTSASRAV